MNMPMPTWSVSIVVNGKIIRIGLYTSISAPNDEEIKKMAKKEGYSSYTDSSINQIDDGRDD